MVTGTRAEAEAMAGPLELPRSNGELVFDAPWEGRAFGTAIAVLERLGLPWSDFQQRLITAISSDPERPYYESWAAALEALLLHHGLVTLAEVDEAEALELEPDH
jgi:nitrile hydratase accessory protein